MSEDAPIGNEKPPASADEVPVDGGPAAPVEPAEDAVVEDAVVGKAVVEDAVVEEEEPPLIPAAPFSWL